MILEVETWSLPRLTHPCDALTHPCYAWQDGLAMYGVSMLNIIILLLLELAELLFYTVQWLFADRLVPLSEGIYLCG